LEEKLFFCSSSILVREKQDATQTDMSVMVKSTNFVKYTY
jgi:hypothetical protein